VTRHFFLIALLSVLLPGTVLPVSRDAIAPRPFVSSLRSMPGAGRAMARTLKRSVAGQPVRGEYIVAARTPKAALPPPETTSLPDRFTPTPVGLRAPPAFA
jgi:hypothetical protein